MSNFKNKSSDDIELAIIGRDHSSRHSSSEINNLNSPSAAALTSTETTSFTNTSAFSLPRATSDLALTSTDLPPNSSTSPPSPFTYISSGSSNTTLGSSDTAVGRQVDRSVGTSTSTPIIPRRTSSTANANSEIGNESPLLGTPKVNTPDSPPPSYLLATANSAPVILSTPISVSSTPANSSVTPTSPPAPVYTTPSPSVLEQLMNASTPSSITSFATFRRPPPHTVNVQRSRALSLTPGRHPWAGGRFLPSEAPKPIQSPFRRFKQALMEEVDPQGIHIMLLLATAILFAILLIAGALDRIRTDFDLDHFRLSSLMASQLVDLAAVLSLAAISYAFASCTSALATFARQRAFLLTIQRQHGPPHLDYCMICTEDYRSHRLIKALAGSEQQQLTTMKALHQDHVRRHLLEALNRLTSQMRKQALAHRPITAQDCLGAIVLLLLNFLIALLIGGFGHYMHISMERNYENFARYPGNVIDPYF